MLARVVACRARPPSLPVPGHAQMLDEHIVEIHQTLSGNSSTFETLLTRWLSIFGPISTLAKGSSSVNFPSGHFRVFVTLSDFGDHSITFPDYVILLDYISHLTLTGLELKSLSSLAISPPK